MAAGTIGNVLEWYDFSIYGFFAIAIGRTFFPQEEPVTRYWRRSACSPPAT